MVGGAAATAAGGEACPPMGELGAISPQPRSDQQGVGGTPVPVRFPWETAVLY